MTAGPATQRKRFSKYCRRLKGNMLRVSYEKVYNFLRSANSLFKAMPSFSTYFIYLTDDGEIARQKTVANITRDYTE